MSFRLQLIPVRGREKNRKRINDMIPVRGRKLETIRVDAEEINVIPVRGRKLLRLSLASADIVSSPLGGENIVSVLISPILYKSIIPVRERKHIQTPTR